MADGIKTDTGILHKSIQSGKWFLFGTISQRLINLAAFFVLARLLMPKDYGVLAIVFIVTNFLDRVSAPGFGTALMQKRESVEHYLDTVWTFDLIKSILIAGLIFFLGGYISNFFKIEDSDAIIIKLSGLLIVISALSNSRQLYFFKNLDFKKVFWRDLAGHISYTLVAIGWALFISATVWALFVGYLARYVAGLIMSYILYPIRPRLVFYFSRLKDLFGYSKWIYGQNMLDYFLSSIDNIFVGRLLNTAQLGFYSRARDLPSTFSSPFLSMISKIGFPAYAKVQDRLDKIQEGFLKSMHLLLLITVPLSLLLILEGGTIVSVFLGQKWLPIVVPLKILSFANIFIGLVGLVKPIFNAVGRPEINFKINIIQLIVSVPLIYLGIKFFQLKGAAMAVVIIWLILLFFTIFQARPILKLGKDRIFAPLVSVFAASLGTFIIAVLFRGFIHSHFSSFFIIGWVAVLGVIYFLMIWLAGLVLKEGPWFTIKSILRELK